MWRRTFLKAAIASTTSPLAGSILSSATADPASAAERPPIVDTHMHVWGNDPAKYPFAHPYQPDAKPPEVDGSLETLVADMDAGGVTHAILVQTICHGWDNRYLVHCVRANPRRFRGHGLIDPADPAVADKLAYWVGEQGLAGMRFSPIYYLGRDEWLTAEAHRKLWKKARDLGVIFNFYIATEQLPKLAVMVEQFPEVPVIVDHLSQIKLTGPDPQAEMNKLLALARHKNVYVKVSELTSIAPAGKYPFADALPWVRQVYDAFGSGRLLWGTGYPGAARAYYKRPTLAEELALVREQIPFFNSADQRQILGENAARLWKLESAAK